MDYNYMKIKSIGKCNPQNGKKYLQITHQKKLISRIFKEFKSTKSPIQKWPSGVWGAALW